MRIARTLLNDLSEYTQSFDRFDTFHMVLHITNVIRYLPLYLILCLNDYVSF